MGPAPGTTGCEGVFKKPVSSGEPVVGGCGAARGVLGAKLVNVTLGIPAPCFSTPYRCFVFTLARECQASPAPLRMMRGLRRGLSPLVKDP